MQLTQARGGKESCDIKVGSERTSQVYIIGKTKWDEVKGQTLPGKDDFVDRFAEHLRSYKDIPESPRSQRYANRLPLDKFFPESIIMSKGRRDRKIAEAVEKRGYTQKAIAKHLGMHFTYVSQIVKRSIR